MNVRRHIASHCLTLVSLAGGIAAQTAAPNPVIPNAAGTASATSSMFFSTGQMGAGIGVPSFTAFKAIAGLPYSAEQVLERVQTLPDGTHITHLAQKTLLFRDSAGRTRAEHTFTGPAGSSMPLPSSIVEITDPVAGYRYSLNQRNQTALRIPWPPTVNRTTTNPRQANGQVAPPSPVSTATPSSPQPQSSRESLGTQMIEGLTAEGIRTTVVYPENSIGNDRPITTTSEIWTSPDLKLVLLRKSSDPRTGESTTRTTNISRSEPDPALFQPPAGYAINDQTTQVR